jgi:hypothetical protein
MDPRLGLFNKGRLLLAKSSAVLRLVSSTSRPQARYLTPEEYEGRLGDLRGAIADSHLSIRELSARTRLATLTIYNLQNGKTKHPRDYTVQVLWSAIDMPNPYERVKGMNKYIGAWLAEDNRRKAAKKRRSAKLKRKRLALKSKRAKKGKKK